MNRLFGIGVAFLIALCALFLTPADAPAQQDTVKYVIVMISDGWGINHIKATNYWHGIESQVYEKFPVCLYMSTYSQNGIEDAAPHPAYDPAVAWTDFGYLLLRASESAATTTAMVTGAKTYDGRVNVDSEGNTLFTVTDRASALGKSVGVVTSVSWSHATPACYLAHNISRRNYTEIAQEMLGSDAAIIMGCGNPDFDNNHQPATPSAPNDWRYVGGETQWNDLLTGNTDWALIQSRAEFQALMVDPNPPPRVCGTAQCRLTLQQRRTTVAGEEAGGTALPYTAPLNDVPTLEEITQGALNVLDENPRGFLLMVEGGAIDWTGHSSQMGRLIEEQTEFNNAVDAVIAWVEANSNWDETLVIVTGDHECGYLWGPGSGPPHTFNEIVDNGAGNLPGGWFYSDSHSNSLIPLYAKGAAALRFLTYADEIDSVRGPYIDNTEVAKVIFDYYGAPD
jgi:alkaline phosphatase